MDKKETEELSAEDIEFLEVIRKIPDDFETPPDFHDRVMCQIQDSLPKNTEESPRKTSNVDLRLLPLFGREQELSLLFQCRERSESGTAEIVFVNGEVGIGKTALISIFLKRISYKKVEYIYNLEHVDQKRCLTFFEDSKIEPSIFIIDNFNKDFINFFERDYLRPIENTLFAKLLTIIISRQELHKSINSMINKNLIKLDRLSDSDIVRIILSETVGKGFPRKVLQEMIKLSEGNPFFAKEIARYIMASGVLIEGDDRYEVLNKNYHIDIEKLCNDLHQMTKNELRPLVEM